MKEQSIYVIGDVHGMLDPLKELLQGIADDARRREVTPFHLFVGDLIDRGPDSATVVRLVRELTESGAGAAVLGNHDEMFLQTLTLNRRDLLDLPHPPSPGVSGPLMLRHWLSQGGDTTLESFGVEPTAPETWRFPEEELRFMETLPLYWENDSIVVTHALPSRDALRRAREPRGETVPEVRHELLWQRELPPEPPDPERLHLSGHTPLRNAVFHEALNAVQLDTACVYGVALSAYVVETGELISIACNS